MIAMLGGFLAKSMLMQSPIGGLLKAIPAKAWLAIAVALAIAAGVMWHQHKAHAAIAAAEKRGEARANAAWKGRFDRMRAHAEQVRIRAETVARNIAQDVRSRNEQEARDIVVRAGAQRLRGPGAARCGPVDHPGLSAGAGGRVAPGGGSDAAGPRLPADERAAVPWSWLVDRAQQCDLNRAEVLSWREADARQRAEWEKMRGAKRPH